MKLELKHLAPYLPYKIKMLHYDKKKVLNAGQGSSVHWVGITHSLNHQENTKPLLHPLSRLRKPIKINGKTFIAIEVLKERSPFLMCEENGFVDYMSGKYIYFEHLSYWITERLFEWHFDVFGLIEKGLAEPIETSKAKGE